MKITPARIVSVLYAAVVLGLMTWSLFPDSYGVGRLLAVLVALPWSLMVMLPLDVIDPELIVTLAPPLYALCGFLNAYLLYNALRGRSE
jgi:hypothetical protein